jgi:uncharacterized protein (TIGR00661 family)
MPEDGKLRVLYGVQGTGNGHLACARLVAEEFAQLKETVTVDYVISSRQTPVFDMQAFGNFRQFAGLTFTYWRGQVCVFLTVLYSLFSIPFRWITDVPLA